MDPRHARLLRQIPSVDELLRHPALAEAVAALSRPRATEVVRRVLSARRQEILRQPPETLPPRLELATLEQELAQALAAAARPSLQRVINATGVIIHTNLGRSCLAEAALEQILRAGRHYSNLEYDLEAGRRGSRQAHLEGVLCELTRAEAALVVNNNAAAVFLCLSALAKDREVIISRGQLVEIGGSFRMPDVMAMSGARLVEVGTTNKTYLADYERAITSQTAMLLKVHPSNYRIRGFTREVPLAELSALGRRYGLWVMEDLGSGCLVELGRFGLEPEPTVQEAVAAGADLVTVSGDKLLGGPQAGIILGRREAVQELRTHPLLRALRPDKLTLAGLEATLHLYFDETRAFREIPTLFMIARPLPELWAQARRLRRALRRRLGERLAVRLVETSARVGGGSLPEEALPSVALALTSPHLSPEELEARLRRATPPVVARLERDQLLLDMRTLRPEDLPLLLQALEQTVAAGAPGIPEEAGEHP
jgi:L-seryl-tRNA(Ser) seleniumtransferase